ncbi:unknown [Pasteurella multocida subsp. multocida str. Pm70]|uniref:Uncharacterized protein PM1972 n=1 Tax=Pasteurella multocida (strain Pm70) TaxID=272843 RepID=Y1972_PASMU|nr:RecName: Full=Uncharacterized protein PM1972; Flags: Precursor [Pasteurella multocida subsp. multocida str. Pm70]AAK04056.1 unknown [Pasteurella multocida subsp. multocida str. Pm70]
MFLFPSLLSSFCITLRSISCDLFIFQIEYSFLLPRNKMKNKKLKMKYFYFILINLFSNCDLTHFFQNRNDL